MSALFEHASDRPVQRARAQLERAVRSRGDVLHDGVAVAVLVGDGDEDVKHRDGQRQQVVGIGRVRAESCGRYNEVRYIRQRYS